MIQAIRCRAAWPALAVALTVFTPGVCAAQATASDKALAETLFDEGRKLLDAHDYAHACPKLARSNELDEGIGTLLYLADCYEKSGQNASAWATFREAASRANARGETERERIATRRAGVLEPLLAKLTIVVEGNADLPGLVVTRDARPVGRELWGMAAPIDAGVHSFDVTAPGKIPWHGSLTLADGEARMVKIPALLDAPPASVRQTASAPSASGLQAPPQLPPSPDTPAHPSDARRTASYVLGALGVIGLGLGTGYGLAARSKNETADAHCARPGGLCDPTGVAAGHDVNRLATTSNVAFGVGAAFSVAAFVLLVTAPKRAAASAKWRIDTIASKQGGQISLAGSLP